MTYTRSEMMPLASCDLAQVAIFSDLLCAQVCYLLQQRPALCGDRRRKQKESTIGQVGAVRTSTCLAQKLTDIPPAGTVWK